MLAVVIPVIGSTTTRLAPGRWDQYKPPEHLWFWSARAMRALLDALGHRALAAVAGPRVVTDSVAFYARVGPP